MKCPHCDIGINWSPNRSPVITYYANDGDQHPLSGEVAWEVQSEICPECDEPIMFLLHGEAQEILSEDDTFTGVAMDSEYTEHMIWPRSGGRPCPPEVPKELREDFEESAQVLSISPKASAALSRRCLQHLLREFAGTKSKDLAKQIQEVIESKVLSSHLADQLDAMRNIGNFAAHPQKALSTGEILPVEPHEAEWNLEVLEELFDHFFTKPAKVVARREKLNEKLLKAGKPLLPSP